MSGHGGVVEKIEKYTRTDKLGALEEENKVLKSYIEEQDKEIAGLKITLSLQGKALKEKGESDE